MTSFQDAPDEAIKADEANKVCSSLVKSNDEIERKKEKATSLFENE